MSELELFMVIFKKTHMDVFLKSFVVFYIIACLLMYFFDPELDSLYNAFWLGFMLITTIGFGDFTVVSLPSRLVAAALGLYGIVLIAFVCGVGAAFFFEKFKSQRDESVSQMLWKLEHLNQLSSREIKSLQTSVKAIKEKQKIQQDEQTFGRIQSEKKDKKKQ